jgi:hypothetical protein
MTIMGGNCIDCGKFTATWIKGTETKEIKGFDGITRKFLICEECAKKRKKK